MTDEDKLTLKKLITEYFKHCSKLPHNNDIRMWGKELMHYEVEDLNVAFKHAMDVSAYLATPKQIASFTIEFKAIREKAEEMRDRKPSFNKLIKKQSTPLSEKCKQDCRFEIIKLHAAHIDDIDYLNHRLFSLTTGFGSITPDDIKAWRGR